MTSTPECGVACFRAPCARVVRVQGVCLGRMLLNSHTFSMDPFFALYFIPFISDDFIRIRRFPSSYFLCGYLYKY